MKKSAVQKRCGRCNSVKPLKDFYKCKSQKYGRYHYCITCQTIAIKDWRERHKKTVKLFAKEIWSGINSRTINGKHPQWQSAPNRRYLEKGIRLEMTRDEWNAFVEQNRSVIERLYATGETPSVDRINPDGNYSLSNIRIIGRDDNRRRARARTSKLPSVAIDTCFVGEYGPMEDDRKVWG